MLILSRNIGQTIVIGDDMTVTVVAVKGHHISLAITALRDVSAHRDISIPRSQWRYWLIRTIKLHGKLLFRRARHCAQMLGLGPTYML